MTTGRNSKRSKPSLEDRFIFRGDAVAPGDREALRSALFKVEDRISGADRCLKLWRKSATQADEDLRLAPDIIEAILDQHGTNLTLDRLMRPLPATWDGQRADLIRKKRCS
jgi:hypothetical protein